MCKSRYKLDLPNFNPIIIGNVLLLFLSFHLKKCIKSINHLGFVIAIISWRYKSWINFKYAWKWDFIFLACYCLYILINWIYSLCSKVKYNYFWVFDIDSFFWRIQLSICKLTHTMIIVFQLSQCNCWTLDIAKPTEFLLI